MMNHHETARFWLLLFPAALAVGGGALLGLGGRPLLFGSLVLFGLAVLALAALLPVVLPGAAWTRTVRRVFAALVLAGALAFAALEGMIYMNAGTQITGEPEVMVVLGAKLWNHAPSPVLESRLDAAADYLEEHPNMLVVVTGGMGDDEPVSEASCMAQILEKRGIPKDRILLEEKATNTFENLKNSKALLEKQGYSTDRLLVVTNGAHLARVKLLARRCGLEIDTLSAPVPGGIGYKTYFRARESAALVKSFLFDR